MKIRRVCYIVLIDGVIIGVCQRLRGVERMTGINYRTLQRNLKNSDEYKKEIGFNEYSIKTMLLS